jgi:hypothetical protein
MKAAWGDMIPGREKREETIRLWSCPVCDWEGLDEDKMATKGMGPDLKESWVSVLLTCPECGGKVYSFPKDDE